jgi:hypothetical protein
VKNHVSSIGGATSIWAILPAGDEIYGEIRMWFAVFLMAHVVDGVGSGFWVEFDGILE